ncbi:MAG: MdtA/MuxA family multidrug efflux RND transporter periplasmic adaptor subunit [Thermodesulfobacteriota bacterium]
MLEENSERKESLNQTPGRTHHYWWIWVLALCLAGVGTYAYFSKAEKGRAQVAKPQAGPANRSVPVAAVAAKKSDLDVYLNGLGSVTPLNTVTVKSRVDGQLMEVLFKEGQIVRSGQLLARIDPRPFEVQLTQAEGQMARDQAILNNAKNDLVRYQTLWKQDLIQKQLLDTQEALVRQNEGVIKSDQGQIDNAKLQLVYSRITAPISGRVGLRLVDPGNIIHATDPNGLLVITQIQPISVIFSLPEDNIPQVLGQLKGGRRPQVVAFDRDQNKKLAVGHLMTIDNQIDPNTGTVRLKALFENKDNQLFPNQFVNARLLAEVRQDIIIIPAAAIQQGPKGAFVYLIKADRTVSVRPVSVGEVQGGDASIKSGLNTGDLVVVDGADRLREGAKVELRGKGNGNGTGRRSR